MVFVDVKLDIRVLEVGLENVVLREENAGTLNLRYLSCFVGLVVSLDIGFVVYLDYYKDGVPRECE